MSKMELEALAFAAWPSSAAEDRCARAAVSVLSKVKQGPSGPHTMRTSYVVECIKAADPAAWEALPNKSLKAVLAHTAPHIILCDDPTCTNSRNAAVKLLCKSLQTRTRPQLDQLPSSSSEFDEDENAGKEGMAGTPSEASGWQSLQLCTPDAEPANGGMHRGSEGGAPCEATRSLGPVDPRLLAIASYPPQSVPPHMCSFECNVMHLRCVLTCFLLSAECAKGPLGPHSAGGPRISNVLRGYQEGKRWDAIGGRGSRLSLLADKALILEPLPREPNAVGVRLDVAALQQRVQRTLAKVIPNPDDAAPHVVTVPTTPKPAGASKPADPQCMDPGDLPWPKEVANALRTLTNQAFPGSEPLNQLRRKACNLMIQYGLAVHMTRPMKQREPKPTEAQAEDAQDGWQLATKHKPKASHPPMSPLSLSTGYGAMPCTVLGQMLQRAMPQKFNQIPVASGGKRLRGIYRGVPCFIAYPGPQTSENYVKLDIHSLAGMGALGPEDALEAITAINTLLSSSTGSLPNLPPLPTSFAPAPHPTSTNSKATKAYPPTTQAHTLYASEEERLALATQQQQYEQYEQQQQQQQQQQQADSGGSALGNPLDPWGYMGSDDQAHASSYPPDTAAGTPAAPYAPAVPSSGPPPGFAAPNFPNGPSSYPPEAAAAAFTPAPFTSAVPTSGPPPGFAAPQPLNGHSSSSGINALELAAAAARMRASARTSGAAQAGSTPASGGVEQQQMGIPQGASFNQVGKGCPPGFEGVLASQLQGASGAAAHTSNTPQHTADPAGEGSTGDDGDLLSLLVGA